MQDLGNLVTSPSPLIGNSSMCATNTVSDQTGSMTGAGSPSEQTVDVPARVPVQEIPPRIPRPVLVSNDAYHPSAVAWKMLPQNGYSEGSA